MSIPGDTLASPARAQAGGVIAPFVQSVAQAFLEV